MLLPVGTDQLYKFRSALFCTLYLAMMPEGFTTDGMNTQAFEMPATNPGVAGDTRFTVILLAVLVPQLLTDRTLIMLVTKLVAKVTLILVPLFSVMVTPAGTDHW